MVQQVKNVAGRNNDKGPAKRKRETEKAERKSKKSRKEDVEKEDNMVRRDYMFVINNYTDEHMKVLDKWLRMSKCMQVQQEVGKEKGTPHLQGYVYFNSMKKRSVMFAQMGKKFDCQVPKNAFACRNYCKKFETARIGEKVWRKEWPEKGKKDERPDLFDSMEAQYEIEWQEEFRNVIWKEFQKFAISILQQAPDDRTVWWFCDEDGNCGKSFLARYLAHEFGAFICGGAYKDCAKIIEQLGSVKGMELPKCVIYDLARSKKNFCSYGFMEDVKDRLVISTKNDSKAIKLHRMHVIVFANSRPKTMVMSRDRFKVFNIQKDGSFVLDSVSESASDGPEWEEE